MLECHYHKYLVEMIRYLVISSSNRNILTLMNEVQHHAMKLVLGIFPFSSCFSFFFCLIPLIIGC